MGNTAKKATKATDEAANTTKGAEVKTTMQVVKSEPEAEAKQPEKPTPPPTIEELKAQIFDRYNLVEKHETLSGQLADLKNFEANITNDARVRIENGGGRIFSSADPAAVRRQIEYCRQSIEEHIKEVENLLYA
jgi:hypothetical protein